MRLYGECLYACPDEDECATPEDWVPPDAEFECDGLGSGGIGSGGEPDCGFDDSLAFDPWARCSNCSPSRATCACVSNARTKAQ